MEIGIKDAKVELSRLVRAALEGEKVVITHRGLPVVRLVPEISREKDRRQAYGSLKGLLSLPSGWDAPEADQEILEKLEGLE